MKTNPVQTLVRRKEAVSVRVKLNYGSGNISLDGLDLQSNYRQNRKKEKQHNKTKHKELPQHEERGGQMSK